MLQEVVRNKIEWVFGVPQAQCGFVCRPCRLWELENANLVIISSIILHNIIFKEKYETDPFILENISPHTPDIQCGACNSTPLLIMQIK